MYNYVTGRAAGRESFSTKTDNELFKVKCKLSCCKTCSYCARALPKERVKSRVSRLSVRKQIKICQRCFLCHSIVLCKTCNKCQKCCLNSACRGETSKLLANLAGSGCRSESGSNPERGLHPPLSYPAKAHKVSHSHKLLCPSPQEPLPVGGITSAYRQECSRTSTKPNINRLFLVPKPNNKWRPILDLKRLNLFLKAEKFKTETPGNHQNIPPTRAMGHLNRLQGHLLPYTNTGTIQEIFHVQGQTYQFKALPFSLSTAPLEFTVVAKEVKLMAVHKGVRIHQYLDNWLVRARSHQDRWQNVQDKILEI